ncbi:MAG: M20/M25/M40 family metallo-hydrolase [Lentimicrobiaceae bacterium]|nr:M20/M25/M40 family metallo-hydrolase [Lentimicrobiaceae bacterium]
MKKIIYLILFLFVFSHLQTYAQHKATITSAELKTDVYFLASDSLKGRKPGTPESKVAANYILNGLVQSGTKPLCENGFQPFDLITNVQAGKNNMLLFGNFKGIAGKDFIPLSFSANATLSAPVVFAGFGFDADFDSIHLHDYQNMDVKSKWVMMLRGEPDPDNPHSLFGSLSSERAKVLTAKDKGAAGVIFVSGSKFEENDRLTSLSYDMSASDAGLPVINIKRIVADSLLKNSGVTIAQLESDLTLTIKSNSFELQTILTAQTEVIPRKVQAQNIVAWIKGKDKKLCNEYIVIGAHYDHLGMGGANSGSRIPDTVAVHNGADDNASGVAAVLELAGKLAKAKLKRSVIFVLFDAEEMGLIGSKYFVKNSPVPLPQIKAMINVDMLGRFKKDTKTISVSGTGTAAEMDSLLNIAEKGRTFTIGRTTEGYGPSDHATFYSENIPVLYFTTGAHDDYHTPADDADKLDYNDEALICNMIADISLIFANMEKSLSFHEAGPKAQPEGGRRFKVTLGIVPDFTSSENKGLRVDGVRKGGPAERGGIKKGDIIIAIDGQIVSNIYDYMTRLTKLKHGQTIIVEVLRNNKKEVLLILL